MDARSAPQRHHQCNAVGQPWPVGYVANSFGFALSCHGMVDGTMLLNIKSHVMVWSSLIKLQALLPVFPN